MSHFISLRYSRQRAIKFANFIALARVSEKVRLSSNFSILFLRIIVFTSIVFAIAGTTIFYIGESIDADYILAIDSSASMLAEDLLPNRFEVAKLSAINFIDNLPIYSSAGVIGFSGTSYVSQPLTIDKNLIKSSIEELSILTTGGTSLGDAVITGTNLLLNSGKPRVVVILTDGRSNLGVSLDSAIEYANLNNVIVNAIGIGSEEDTFFGLNKSIGPLGVDAEELEWLATLTGGKFYGVSSAEELNEVYNDIAGSEKTKVSLDLTLFLLIFILTTLVIEWVLINTRYRIIP